MGAPKILGTDGDARTEASLRQRLSFLEAENAELRDRVQNLAMVPSFERLTDNERSLVLQMVNLLVHNREAVR